MTVEPDLRATILIVDDNPANLLALEAILEPLGHRLVRAESGEEALRKLLEEDFALILMDVQMPGIDGLETAMLIRKRPRSARIPIIFITAISRETAYVFRGYRTGAVDYLMKPIDPEILRAKVSVFVDLHLKTELVKRQEALLRETERAALTRRSEHRYRALTDSIPHGLLTADAEGRVNLCNEVWTDVTGLTCEESAGLGFLDGVHEADRAAARDRWTEATRGAAPFEVRLRLAPRDGRAARWHLCRAVPERDVAGAPSGWIATFTDIQATIEAEEELRRAMRAKDTFLAAASHELRTPLTSAKLQTQLAARVLRDEAPDSPVRRPVEVIARQVDRMVRLVENMLDVAKLEAGQLMLDVERFDLVSLLREACDAAQAMSAKHAIALDAPGPVTVAGDRHRLERVFQNLLSNAIRYSPQGGPIDVVVTAREAEAEVSITDRGLGIPRELQAVIFEPFEQAHGLNYGGLGLGLTIARSIVERHGGAILVDSPGRDGAGTTFRVRLPIGAAAAAATGAARLEPPRAHERGRWPRREEELA